MTRAPSISAMKSVLLHDSSKFVRCHDFDRIRPATLSTLSSTVILDDPGAYGTTSMFQSINDATLSGNEAGVIACILLVLAF